MADDPETTDTEAPAEPVTEAETPPADALPEGAATTAEPEPVLAPKERKARRRAAAVAKRGPRRGATQADRDAERKRKAAQRRRYRQRAKAKKAELESQPSPEPAPRAVGQQKVRQGIVMSDKADKTITVRIDVARRHRRYQKTIRSSSTLHVHDERNEASAGDTVRVVEARPLSRLKRWRLVEVVERAR